MGHFRITIILLLAAFTAYAQQSTTTASGGGGIGIGTSGTNNTFYSPTNYFASDLPANTNGPMAMYRSPGGGGISNLWMETVLGTTSRGLFIWSQTPGDGGAYGGLFMNTDHSGSPPSPNNSELQINSGGNIFFAPGPANPTQGHIQFGALSPGAWGYGSYNPFMVFQSPNFAITQTAPTNFSPALVFNCAEFQGAAGVNFYPAIFSYCSRTNVPGRYAIMFTMDYGGAAGQLWDANSAKKGRVFEITGGDITNAIFYKPINYPTNLGTAAIDCSIPASDFTTAVNVTFTAPVNFDSTAIQYEHIYQFITNSAVGTITLTAPANARLVGTTTVTRQCQVEWWIKIGKWTNGIVTQIF